MNSGSGRVNLASEPLHRGLASSTDRIRRTKKLLKSSSSDNNLMFEDLLSGKKIDPQGPFLQRWNKIFVLSCVIAVSLDPLFFYVSVIDDSNKCLKLDGKMEVAACMLRLFTDTFYILRIVFQFHTGFIAPSSLVFGRGVLVEDTRAIAARYLSSYFLIDISSVLPLPQVVILFKTIIPKIGGSRSLHTKDLMKLVVLCQYVPRFLRIYPLYKEVTRTSGILIETAWAGAAFNLFLYMLASHIFGAIWYLCSIEREMQCWKTACSKHNGCNSTSLYCDRSPGGNSFLNVSCPIKDPNEELFNFGIFLQALQSGIVESTDFPKKFFYCFWWGLKNLSSLGQTLTTSTCAWENSLAVLINISGLVLFLSLMCNMMVYLQSITTRSEEMRVRRRDVEQWMSHRLLPENLRARIRRYDQFTWQETRGVDEQNLLQNLPRDLSRDIKRHLCLGLLMRVPMFEKMDEQLLHAMCARLKPMLCTEESYVVREGDPVEEMLFIMRGKLLTTTTGGGRTGFFNSDFLVGGDFCGEELLTWALDPRSSTNLPISTRTVQTLTEVEAFGLKPNDLKVVATQYRRLHSKQLRHIFRFYSHQWRTWAACFVQAAWRRHRRKQLRESLREENIRLKDVLACSEGRRSASLGATMLPHKPAEPDFTSEDNTTIAQG